MRQKLPGPGFASICVRRFSRRDDKHTAKYPSVRSRPAIQFVFSSTRKGCTMQSNSIHAGTKKQEQWQAGSCLVGCQNVGQTERALSAYSWWCCSLAGCAIQPRRWAWCESVWAAASVPGGDWLLRAVQGARHEHRLADRLGIASRPATRACSQASRSNRRNVEGVVSRQRSAGLDVDFGHAFDVAAWAAAGGFIDSGPSRLRVGHWHFPHRTGADHENSV